MYVFCAGSCVFCDADVLMCFVCKLSVFCVMLCVVVLSWFCLCVCSVLLGLFSCASYFVVCCLAFRVLLLVLCVL